MTGKIGVGINSWVWDSPFRHASLSLLAKAAAMGFDAFTVPIEEPSFIHAAEVRAMASDLGLRLNATGAFGPTRDLTHDLGAYRYEALRYIRDMLALCETMGISLLVGPMYSSTGKRRKLPKSQRNTEWTRAVEGLKKAAGIARDHGVTLGIEPLNRFETDLVNTAEQAKQLVRDIGEANVGIHLDTFHMNIEEKSIYEAVVLAGDDLVYVDASESDRGTPGTGQVDWKGLLAGLSAVSYQGDCVIESFTPACQTIAEAAAVWRPLAPSQDRLAEDGLGFLRQLLASEV